MSNKTDPTGKGTDHIRLWPYAVLGCFLLVVFVAGILAPDYYNYRIALAKTAALSLPPGQITNASASASNAVASALLEPNEIKSADIFETYGKLLTMLLGFVSVLGVLFAYFVRRSLREVEEDMRNHVQTTLGFWGERHTQLAGDVEKSLNEITAQKTAFEEIVHNSRKVLEALEAAAKAEEQKRATPKAQVKDAAAAIDADKSVPKK